MDSRAGVPSPLMAWPHHEFEGECGAASVCDVRIFSAPNVGTDYATAVVTNLGRDDDTSIAPVAEALAVQIVAEFELDASRFIYIEHFPAASETLIQERLIAPARPSRFVRVRFDYSKESGFANPRRELIEVTEVAYLTNMPVECWYRELEETAACNRLYAMLGELGPTRMFELLESALQRQREQAEQLRKSGGGHGLNPEEWERVRQAVVQLVLCAETAVLPEEGRAII